MTAQKPLDIAQLVPGGILPDDHVHRETNDGTCSRCRWAVPEDEVPLHLWFNDNRDMLTYCPTCLDMPAKGRDEAPGAHGQVGQSRADARRAPKEPE